MSPHPQFVSVHGGHSGQFCDHAIDSLEEIILRYIELGFSWVGVTEHTPAISSPLLDPGQVQAGLTPELLLATFTEYMKECRRLQEKYKDELTIFAAMEIETYSGYEQFVPFLLDRFQPDYIVGSVHFVDDISIDYSQKTYAQAVQKLGGVDELYKRYFDLQYEMIERFRPSVVGHFDLIRIFDADYKTRLMKPAILEKIRRNLQLIHELDLIMDLNLRSLVKGADEPYISRPILKLAGEMGISVVPGDDSHGVQSVGGFMNTGINLLEDLGFSTNWKKPQLYRY
ncbi:histidinol-phosphatase HisJ family protein [Desulforhopalus sp. IMCC35007]|nr:histidinol-phosphatase HisJ family protein [Desulforhopalus sp. IMCC35007]